MGALATGARQAGLVLALLLMPTAAASEGLVCDCERDCPQRSDPAAGLAFDDEQHRLWYEVRFWQGDCHPALSWCFTGDDWYDLMAELLARSPGDRQVELCPRLFALGRRIGHEWARDNDLRRIDTDDLEDWQETLLEAADPAAALDRLEPAVAGRLE